MIITALSDIHNDYDSLARILDLERTADVVLIAGDITTYGTPAEAGAAMEKIITPGRKLLAVAGNMDAPESDMELERMGISLNARGVRIGEVGFFGVSAAPRSPLHTPYEISEEETERRLDAGYRMISGAPVKICVPHSPPLNTELDRINTGMHVGSTAIRKFIEMHQPDVVVCGHIHEARGQDTLGKTRMVNCGPAHKGYYVRITISNGITIETKELERR